MKYCAVICEYNPFHLGHRYQLEKAVRTTAADGIIAVMSGSFVQRAEPAIADPFLRAECALQNGVSLVVQLPTTVATAAGRDFARGGVRAVTALPDVKYLVMGCEDEAYIETLAEIQYEESPSFKAVLKESLDAGTGYATAYTTATAMEAEKRGIERTMSDTVLKKPNNLLCIEYIKALKEANSDIKPLLIKRKGNEYNDVQIGRDFASATAIRQHIATDPDLARTQMPGNVADKMIDYAQTHPLCREAYDALVIDSIRRADTDYLKSLRSVAEGIENKLKDAALNAVSLAALYDDVKTKRYTMSRLKRIALECLLGITKDNAAAVTPYRILGVCEDFKYYLSGLDNRFYVSPVGINGLDIEKRASSIYSLITRRPGNSFYSTRLVTV